MTEPFTFTDRIAAMIGAPAALLTETRRALKEERKLPARINALPIETVRKHVAEVVLASIPKLLKTPLLAELEKLDGGLAEEVQMLWGEFPEDDETAQKGWNKAYDDALLERLASGDFERMLGADRLKEIVYAEAEYEELVDEILAIPITDVSRAFRECGVKTEDLEAIVVELRRASTTSTASRSEVIAAQGAAETVAQEPEAPKEEKISIKRGLAEMGEAPKAAVALLGALRDLTALNEHELAAAIGVSRGMMNNYRLGRAPWRPDDKQIDKLRELTDQMIKPLTAAREALETALLM